MNITLIAVGKLKETFWEAACAEYLKRLTPYARVCVREVADIDPAKAGGVPGALEKEAQAIKKAIPARSYVIALAIEGKTYSSEGFSAFLDECALKGKSDLTFIIGGSEGLSTSLHSEIHATFSFGSLTLPHNLARVVLLEQLYRGFKISRGEPYHK